MSTSIAEVFIFLIIFIIFLALITPKSSKEDKYCTLYVKVPKSNNFLPYKIGTYIGEGDPISLRCALWFHLFGINTCPNCASPVLHQYITPDLVFKITCLKCRTQFWATPLAASGAHFITPKDEVKKL